MLKLDFDMLIISRQAVSFKENELFFPLLFILEAANSF